MIVLSINAYGQNRDLNTFEASVVKVYDGDTFTALVKVPNFRNTYSDFSTKKVKVRLHACDTYELMSQNSYDRYLAIKAREYTKRLLGEGVFNLRYVDKDRYKRLVCEVIFKDGSSLKEILRDADLLTGKYEN